VPISGNATTETGSPVDFVRIFNWPSEELAGVVTPDENGDWQFSPFWDGNYGITYIAQGCQPITHGPYWIEGDASIPTDSLIMYFDMEGSGTEVTDKSGNGYHAELMGGATRELAGLIGYSLRCNGRNQFAQLPSNIPSMPTNMTVSLWIKVERLKTDQQMILEALLGRSVNLQMGENQAPGLIHLRGQIGGSWTDFLVSPNPISIGEWHHILVEKEDKIFTLSINNTVQAVSEEVEVSTTSGAMRLGGRETTADRTLNGEMDLVRVYNRILTANEKVGLFAEPART